MNRRHFFKLATGGALLAGVSPTIHAAEPTPAALPGALGMLYDSTLCVGCQACVSKCQQVNSATLADPHDPHGPYAAGHSTWSNNDKLSPYTNNIIQVWRSGDGTEKDQSVNGYAYIKKQCMQCVDPNCVSVCPVSALTKDPRTGIVHYDADICTGCRYCMVGCPFDVPKYDYANPFGKLHKCEMCNQKGLARLDQGGLPGCVEVCPTGAVIFGTRAELLDEARRRLNLKPGDRYAYPRQTLAAGDPNERPVPTYQPHLYGETEGGGTQVLVLTGVPFGNLELPALEPLSTGARAEYIQHTLYRGMVLPLALLAGITTLVHRNGRRESDDGKDDKHDDA
jgi:Fe-S-cluster-containing dehydrogenase component